MSLCQCVHVHVCACACVHVCACVRLYPYYNSAHNSMVVSCSLCSVSVLIVRCSEHGVWGEGMLCYAQPGAVNHLSCVCGCVCGSCCGSNTAGLGYLGNQTWREHFTWYDQLAFTPAGTVDGDWVM